MWDQSGLRRTVVFSFLAALSIPLVLLVPGVSRSLESVPWLKGCWEVLTGLLGLSLAALELRHSGEANEHRERLNQLNEQANTYRGEANRLREENNGLQRERHKLQLEANELQQEIESKWSKIRLYARVHRDGDGLKLFVSNLSEFDLWINNVQLVVSQAGDCRIGGTSRISKGQMEDGYKLWGNLISMNRNRTDNLDMKFHVKVMVVGVEDNPVLIGSPRYHVKVVNGKTVHLSCRGTFSSDDDACTPADVPAA